MDGVIAGMVESMTTQAKIQRSLQELESKELLTTATATTTLAQFDESFNEPSLYGSVPGFGQFNIGAITTTTNTTTNKITEAPATNASKQTTLLTSELVVGLKQENLSQTLVNNADSETATYSTKTGDQFLTKTIGDITATTNTTEYQRLPLRELVSPEQDHYQQQPQQTTSEIDIELFSNVDGFKPYISKISEHLSETENTYHNYSPTTQTSICASTNIKLLQRQIGDATASADQRLHLKQHQNLNHSTAPIGDTPSTTNSDTQSNLGYHLRALNEDISPYETNPWFEGPTLPHNIHVSSLSTELVNETLNYFVNCGQRLSQMTKTYDDNDAYILLLQEKEVDLELAARIGQDLLKQNNELKGSIKNLEDELAKRQDDLQQLKHELASKTSLLDTFIEEEEHQTSLAEIDDDSTLRQQDYALNSGANKSNAIPNSQSTYLLPSTSRTPDIGDDDDLPTGFLSLNYQKPVISSVEPFSSLPPFLSDAQYVESSSKQQHHQLKRANSDDTLSEDLNQYSSKPNEKDQKLVQTVTFQLVESNKRLCELQDELLYKSEQNLLQQEKIFKLQEQIRESDRRLGDIATENESLHKSLADAAESRKELSEELKVCKRNFNELLRVFLELQKESRFYRNKSMQQDSSLNYYGELDSVNDDLNNLTYDSYNNAAIDAQNDGLNEEFKALTKCSNTIHKTVAKGKRVWSSRCGNSIPTSSSLLEELQESMQKSRGRKGERNFADADNSEEDGNATDGDSGVHTRATTSTGKNLSSSSLSTSSTSPTGSAVNYHSDDNDDPTQSDHDYNAVDDDDDDDDQEETGDRKRWLGLSSFMITTLLILCLSVTLTSNYNLAHRLQIKLDR